MWRILLFLILLLNVNGLEKHKKRNQEKSNNYALVTLVTGKQSGYSYGAVALGESLKLVGSKLKRIVMVTSDVGEEERVILRIHWEIREVEPIPCYHKYKSQSQDTTHYPDGLQQDMMRWKQTCTKFNAWKLTEYDRIIFMDSDTIVLNSIDDAFMYSNASLVAAPECFPPDTFNSGFMILTPSLDTFHHLLSVGNEKGSAEGGDQGILNNYYCHNWFFVNDDDPYCGRLPWTYNVEAQYYETYKSYRKLYDMEPMRVIHYINDGKPWKTLMYDYNANKLMKTPMIEALSSPSYVASHMYWRYCFLRATGMPRPETSIYYEKWDDVVQKRGIYRSLNEPFYDQEEGKQERENEVERSEIHGDDEIEKKKTEKKGRGGGERDREGGGEGIEKRQNTQQQKNFQDVDFDSISQPQQETKRRRRKRVEESLPLSSPETEEQSEEEEREEEAEKEEEEERESDMRRHSNLKKTKKNKPLPKGKKRKRNGHREFN